MNIKKIIFEYVSSLKKKFNDYSFRASYYKTMSGMHIVNIIGDEVNNDINFIKDVMTFSFDISDKYGETVVFTSPNENVYDDKLEEWEDILFYDLPTNENKVCETSVILVSRNSALASCWTEPISKISNNGTRVSHHKSVEENKHLLAA